jgi:hypothetical protein
VHKLFQVDPAQAGDELLVAQILLALGMSHFIHLFFFALTLILVLFSPSFPSISRYDRRAVPHSVYWRGRLAQQVGPVREAHLTHGPPPPRLGSQPPRSPPRHAQSRARAHRP